jgi:hypothetical protein
MKKRTRYRVVTKLKENKLWFIQPRIFLNEVSARAYIKENEPYIVDGEEIILATEEVA